MSQSGVFGPNGTPPPASIVQIDADTGSATPILGVINLFGSTNIDTTGSGNTINVLLTDDVTISGNYTTTGGNLNLPTTLSTGLEGVITINSVPYIHNFANNIIIGKNAANFTLTIGVAINNTIIGEGSFDGITTGANNTVIGEDTMLSATSASINTVVGASALAGITSGNRNLALGAAAGSNMLSTESDNILVGSAGVASDNHTIRIGTDGTGDLEQDTCFIAGIIGNTVSNPQLVTIDSVSGQLGVTTETGFAQSFIEDVGTATPSAGAIDVLGGSNINTVGSGSTITINLDNTVSISGSMTAGTGLIATTGGITATGTSNINTTGSAVTSIGTGGTGATNIGNTTGNTAVTGSLTASTGLTATTGGITATGTSNINTTGAAITTLGTGGTGAVNIGNATGNTAVTGSLTASTGLTATAGGITATGTSNINTSGASVTSIGTGGTGAVNIGNATGNTAVTGSLTASTGLTATAGGITATGTSNINTSGSAITTIGLGGTGAVRIGNTTGNTAVTGSLTASTSLTATAGNVTITAGNLLLPTTNLGGTHGVIKIGANPFMHNGGASSNTFLGINAGDTYLVTSGTGTSNTGMGNTSLFSLSGTESGNSGFGGSTLLFCNGGSNNTAVGSGALGNVTTGSSNTSLGQNSGANYSSTEASNITIGNTGTIGESNKLRIGTAGSGVGQVNACFIAGITGVTVTGATTLCSATGQLGTVASSERYKENIVDISTRSKDILSLRPVVFNYKKDETKKIHYGLIAEQVHKILPELVLYNEAGEIETIAYHELPILLLNELIRVSKRLEEWERLYGERK